MAQVFTLNGQIDLSTEVCYKCGCMFAMPSNMKKAALNDPTQTFYCPSGHAQGYTTSREERLRKEAEAKLQHEINRREILEREIVSLKKRQNRTTKK